MKTINDVVKYIKEQMKELKNGYDDIAECEDEGEINRYETFVEVLDFIRRRDK